MTPRTRGSERVAATEASVASAGSTEVPCSFRRNTRRASTAHASDDSIATRRAQTRAPRAASPHAPPRRRVGARRAAASARRAAADRASASRRDLFDATSSTRGTTVTSAGSGSETAECAERVPTGGVPGVTGRLRRRRRLRRGFGRNLEAASDSGRDPGGTRKGLECNGSASEEAGDAGRQAPARRARRGRPPRCRRRRSGRSNRGARGNAGEDFSSASSASPLVRFSTRRGALPRAASSPSPRAHEARGSPACVSRPSLRAATRCCAPPGARPSWLSASSAIAAVFSSAARNRDPTRLAVQCFAASSSRSRPPSPRSGAASPSSTALSSLRVAEPPLHFVVLGVHLALGVRLVVRNKPLSSGTNDRSDATRPGRRRRSRRRFPTRRFPTRRPHGHPRQSMIRVEASETALRAPRPEALPRPRPPLAAGPRRRSPSPSAPIPRRALSAAAARRRVRPPARDVRGNASVTSLRCARDSSRIFSAIASATRAISCP